MVTLKCNCGSERQPAVARMGLSEFRADFSRTGRQSTTGMALRKALPTPPRRPRGPDGLDDEVNHPHRRQRGETVDVFRETGNDFATGRQGYVECKVALASSSRCARRCMSRQASDSGGKRIARHPHAVANVHEAMKLFRSRRRRLPPSLWARAVGNVSRKLGLGFVAAVRNLEPITPASIASS